MDTLGRPPIQSHIQQKLVEGPSTPLSGRATCTALPSMKSTTAPRNTAGAMQRCSLWHAVMRRVLASSHFVPPPHHNLLPHAAPHLPTHRHKAVNIAWLLQRALALKRRRVPHKHLVPLIMISATS